MNTRAPLPHHRPPHLHFLLFTITTFLLLLPPVINGHDSCCKKHLQPYIPDPNEIPPLYDTNNQPRYIPDPDPENVRPDDWNDEDDGEWEPIMIENEMYVWTPKLIKNVYYKPNYVESLMVEIRKVIPWILLGIILTTLFVTIGTTLLLPKNISLRRLLYKAGPIGGAILGLITPLCSCGSLPVASGLAAAGVPLGTVVSFLTATQSAGVDSAMITWGVLGKDVALIRLGGALLLSISAGLAAATASGNSIVGPTREKKIGGAETKKKENGGSSNGNSSSNNGHTNGTTSAESKTPPPLTTKTNFLMTAFDTATSNAIDVIPAVCFGLCLSTSITYLLPSLYTTYQSLTATTDATEQTDAKNFLYDLMAKIIVLLSTLPLQLCEHTTVTYAAAIQRSGGSVGLSFGFLLLGPASNVPSLVLLLRQQQQRNDDKDDVFGWNNPMKAVVVRVAMALTISALILSYVVDWSGVDLLVEREAASGVNTTDLPDWFVDISPYGMGLLIGISMIKMVVMKWNNKNGKKEHGVNEKEEDCCATGNGCGNKVKVY